MSEKKSSYYIHDLVNIVGNVPSPWPSEGDVPEILNFSAIENADLSETTKKEYRREIDKLLSTGINPLHDFNALSAYAESLHSSHKASLRSALQLILKKYRNDLLAEATPQNYSVVEAALQRVEVLWNTVKIKTNKGTDTQNWLSTEQVKEITSLCGDDLVGKRDWIVLGLLLGAGLRWYELLLLTFSALEKRPTRGGKMRDVLKVISERERVRVIPISNILAKRFREWCELVGGGLVVRSLGKKKELDEGMSGLALFNLVRKYGKMIGIPELSPQDLRRTYAHLGFDAGVPITQIKELLGHASVATTQKYLDLSLDLDNTASDFVPLGGDKVYSIFGV